MRGAWTGSSSSQRSRGPSESGALGRVVGPSVAATIALADADGDGVVSLADFATVHRAAGYSDAQAKAAFAALDQDGDGRLMVDAWQAT